MRKVKLILTVLMVLSGTFAFAQKLTVSGTITDAATGEPLPGAAILIKGSPYGVVADNNGQYTISVEANGTLGFTTIGYQDLEVNVEGRTKIDVALQPDNELLEETIVVAFGSATKESFTGSATVVKSEDIQKTQGSNIIQSLSGKVAGVQMSSSNGAPGSEPTLLIRGYGSIYSGTSPLYVIDGVPFSGDINTIAPSDIESMTVLKDAASSALYGARGANGVVLITTKRANKGEAEISFDMKLGVNQRAMKDYNYIKDPAQYYETHYGALRSYFAENYGEGMAHAYASQALTSTSANGGLGYNIYTLPDGEYLIGTNGKLNPNAKLGAKYTNPIDGNTYLMTPDNWNDYAYKNGARQEYNLTVNGGTEKFKIFASLSYLNNSGIVDKSGFDRLNGRIKAEYQAKKWLKIGANANFSKYNYDQLDNNGESNSTGNIFAFTSQVAPIYPLFARTENGEIYINPKTGLKAYDFGDGTYFPMSRSFITNGNALATTKVDTINSEGNAFGTNGFVEIEFIKGLKLNVNAGYNLDEYRSTTVQNPYYGQFATENGILSKGHGRSYSYNVQQLLTYDNTFGKHTVSALIGHEYYYSESKKLSASKSNMFNQTNLELDGAVVDRSSASSSAGYYNVEGWLARVQYDYAGRYFASASFRRDGSSHFATAKQWGNFWSFGAAWLINKENWFNASWVDLLKIKASVGETGNDSIGSYRYTDLYQILNSANQIGVSFYTKGNPNITWETNINANAGVEFEMFRGRLGGAVELFSRKTRDMLFSFPTAPSIGYTSYYANVGDMVNRGIEFELYGDVVRTKNISLSLNLNGTTFRNEITRLPEERKNLCIDGHNGFASGNYYIGEGLSRYTFYTKEFAGVDPKTGKSLWIKELKEDPEDATKVTGTTTTDKYSEAADRLVGDCIPALYGGFGFNFAAYGVDFSANFTYQIGGLAYDSGYASAVSSPYSAKVGQNFHADVLNAWTPENPNSTIPRFQYNDTDCGSTSSRFLTDASYLNIQNITLGYTFPSKWMQKIKIASLRIFATADNLWYASKRQGLDPRQSLSGSTNATTYSPMRTISGGISIKF